MSEFTFVKLVGEKIKCRHFEGIWVVRHNGEKNHKLLHTYYVRERNKEKLMELCKFWRQIYKIPNKYVWEVLYLWIGNRKYFVDGRKKLV